MIGGHAMKDKVFHPDYNEHREVLMKTVKDGRAAITRGWPRLVCALRMEEGTIWAFRLPYPATRMSFAPLSLFTVFSTTVVHHSLLGASVVLQYMCIELWIHG